MGAVDVFMDMDAVMAVENAGIKGGLPEDEIGGTVEVCE